LGLLAKCLFFFLVVVVVACSFTTDVNSLQDGDCGAGEKACADPQGVMRCVALDRPEYGCARSGCVPCSFPNATPRCDPSHACAVAVCSPGWAHCTSNLADGCETNIGADVLNCGILPNSACNNRCDVVTSGKSHVTDPACANGVCEIGGCNDGYQDCDKQVGNGCECPPGGTCLRTGRCVVDAGDEAGVDAGDDAG
jgi:hypothetical protein